MARIVAIHGVNQFDPARDATAAGVRLADVWTKALNHSLLHPVDRADVELVYYADLLRLADSLEQGAGDDLDRLPPEVERAVLAWGELLGVSPSDEQGRAFTFGRWVADTVAKRYGLDQQAVRGFVARFFPELIAYLHGDARSSVQKRLAGTIEREAPQMVIAHSLGSVVAYDTLWRNPHLQVDVFVTIGSPLAMPDVVFPHLHHDRTGPKGARPHAATAWVNVADPGDVVAIPQPLTDWFDGVTTNVRTGIGAFSTHKAANYLKNRDTAQALQGFLEKPAP